MTKSFESIPVGALYLDDGTDLRVDVVAVTDAETHYGISVRQWVTKSNAERFGISAKNGRTRSTYTGPDGRHGLSLLSPWQIYELADILAHAGTVAERMEASEDAPTESEATA